MSVKNPRHSLLLAALLAVGVAVGVAACGGSSKSSSTTAAASAAAPASGASGPSGPSGRFARFAGIRECLEKNGVTLPKRTPGQAPRGGFFGGGATGGGPQLPNGVSREKFEAAMKKCGAPQGRFGAGARFDSPQRQQAFAKFAACMREHGVNLPAPNTSGHGPIFNTQGLDTTSPQFRSALTACRSDLAAGFGRSGATGSTGEVKTD